MQKLFEILKSPITIFASIGVGIVLGIYLPGFSQALGTLGEIYLFLIQMTVIPILITAIISSLARMVSMPDLGKFLKRLLFSFLFLWLLSSAIGNITGMLTKPGQLNEDAKQVLGDIVETSADKDAFYVSLQEDYTIEKTSPLRDFLVSIIPRNVFLSLVEDNALALVFFSIVCGVAVGLLKKEQCDYMIDLMRGAFEVFKTIIDWVMYLLPFGLLCLISNQVALTGTEILGVMLKFILIFYLTGLIVIFFNSFVIWLRSSESYLTALKAVMQPIIVAFVTRNSFAALNASINSLTKSLSFRKDEVNLIIPLGTTLGRYGNIIYFGLVTHFIAQLYGVHLGFSGFFTSFFLCILAGIGTAGATGFATLTFISVVLSPLGLPLEAVLVVLLSVDPLIDPMRTALIVHTSIAGTSLVANRDTAQDDDIRLAGSNI